MYKKILSIFVTVAVSFSIVAPQPNAYAAPLLGLPEPGAMVGLSAAYKPLMLKGLTVNQDNPFLFDFIVDPGQENASEPALKQEGDRLIRYFLAALTVPASSLWVNLSPYEKNRTVDEALGQTDMGRDLLAQDYILKQITASLIYPEKDLGKTFWNEVYAKTKQKFGNAQVPVNTFNKVWIMADQAEVYEHNQTAFVTKAHLKVMLEQDYLATEKHAAPVNSNDTSAAVLREVIIPQLEKEVNEGKNFAPLRQIFNAIILAGWYKNNLKSSLLNEVYANKSTVKGIDIQDKTIKQQIFDRYLQAYKKGVFNYVKEDEAKTPRKYFSGGVDFAMAVNPAVVQSFTGTGFSDTLVMVEAGVVEVSANARQYGVMVLGDPIKTQADFRFQTNEMLRLATDNPEATISNELIEKFMNEMILYRGKSGSEVRNKISEFMALFYSVLSKRKSFLINNRHKIPRGIREDITKLDALKSIVKRLWSNREFPTGAGELMDSGSGALSATVDAKESSASLIDEETAVRRLNIVINTQKDIHSAVDAFAYLIKHNPTKISFEALMKFLKSVNEKATLEGKGSIQFDVDGMILDLLDQLNIQIITLQEVKSEQSSINREKLIQLKTQIESFDDVISLKLAKAVEDYCRHDPAMAVTDEQFKVIKEVIRDFVNGVDFTTTPREYLAKIQDGGVMNLARLSDVVAYFIQIKDFSNVGDVENFLGQYRGSGFNITDENGIHQNRTFAILLAAVTRAADELRKEQGLDPIKRDNISGDVHVSDDSIQKLLGDLHADPAIQRLMQDIAKIDIYEYDNGVELRNGKVYDSLIALNVRDIFAQLEFKYNFDKDNFDETLQMAIAYVGQFNIKGSDVTLGNGLSLDPELSGLVEGFQSIIDRVKAKPEILAFGGAFDTVPAVLQGSPDAAMGIMDGLKKMLGKEQVKVKTKAERYEDAKDILRLKLTHRINKLSDVKELLDATKTLGEIAPKYLSRNNFELLDAVIRKLKRLKNGQLNGYGQENINRDLLDLKASFKAADLKAQVEKKLSEPDSTPGSLTGADPNTTQGFDVTHLHFDDNDKGMVAVNVEFKNVLNARDALSQLGLFSEEGYVEDVLNMQIFDALGWPSDVKVFEEVLKQYLDFTDKLLELNTAPLGRVEIRIWANLLSETKRELRALSGISGGSDPRFDIFEKYRNRIKKILLEKFEIAIKNAKKAKKSIVPIIQTGLEDGTIDPDSLWDKLAPAGVSPQWKERIFAGLPSAKGFFNSAMVTNGGIDLKKTLDNTAVRKDGQGVQMRIDPAMIERVRREGIDSLTPVIFKVSPVVNIWSLLGLTPPTSAATKIALN